MDPHPLPLLTVDITPDPAVPGGSITLNISGILDIDMPKETMLASFFSDPVKKEIIGEIGQVTICFDQKEVCPKRKEPFNKTMTIPVPDKLSNPYAIVVGLEIYTVIGGCAIATIGDKKLSKTLSSSSFFWE